jgi:hypothetical protein
MTYMSPTHVHVQVRRALPVMHYASWAWAAGETFDHRLGIISYSKYIQLYMVTYFGTGEEYGSFFYLDGFSFVFVSGTVYSFRRKKKSGTVSRSIFNNFF